MFLDYDIDNRDTFKKFFAYENWVIVLLSHKLPKTVFNALINNNLQNYQPLAFIFIYLTLYDLHFTQYVNKYL